MTGKSITQFWLPSEDNPADDPSRFKEIRAPVIGEEGPSGLLLPERTPSASSTKGPHRQGILFREVFSGCGRLSKAMLEAGLGVDDPMEAYPSRGVYVKAADLTRPAVVKELLRRIRAGCYVYMHFGMLCSSFSIMQMMNNGTRRSDRPEGDGTRESEEIGNVLAKAVAMLCEALQEVGASFSIENPQSSLLWKFSPFAALMRFSFDVDLDQCMYQLLPPHLSLSENTFIRKSTRLRTNLHCLSNLPFRCDRQHHHFHCLGKVKAGGAAVSVAQFAGRYPAPLCKAWASLVGASLRDKRPAGPDSPRAGALSSFRPRPRGSCPA